MSENKGLNDKNLPESVAIIMDGNGRWAKKRGLPRTAGHKRGVDIVREIALEANRLGIRHLILYSFSTENWTRPFEEVSFLCKLPGIFFDKFIDELMENQIRVVFSGELEAFPQATQEVIRKAVQQTAGNNGLVLDLAINYGGLREVMLAMKKYAEDIKAGSRENDLSEEELFSYLMVQEPVDLVIRTSGEKRLSNFLPLQSAYAEFVFTDTLWPDFHVENFHQALDEFQQRSRRFGDVR